MDRLRRDQGLAIAGLKLDKDGAVVDIKFHSKTEAARTLLATLGIKEGDESAGLALVELGRLRRVTGRKRDALHCNAIARYTVTLITPANTGLVEAGYGPEA